MDDISACVAQFGAALAGSGVGPGGLQHAIEQMRIAAEAQAADLSVRLEEPIAFSVKVGNQWEDRRRDVDVLIRDLESKTATLVEVKTGANLEDALDRSQLLNDAIIGTLDNFDKGIKNVENVWKLTNVTFDKESEGILTARLETVRTQMENLKFDEADIKKAIGGFHFVDAVGLAVRAQIDENGDIIFEPAMESLLGPDGKLANVALEKSKNSPDFGPAMDVLLGPDGKLADAAQDAAAGSDLGPALDTLEDKIEDGVTAALDEAGEAVSEHGASALAGKIGAGVTALGGVLTAIPQMYASVTKLGEAWDKPLNSTADYMNLLSAAGGALSQAGQTFQAFAGVTQIATAAQAAFNAVMALNPVVLVVIAVVALIAAVALLIVYWDEVKAAIRDNPWIGVIAALTGVIGLVVLIIAYWDEIKLAVLEAANEISISVQAIGAWFSGLGTLVGHVWDSIVAMAINAGASVLNVYIRVGTAVQNFFIELVNSILGMYNEIATSAAGQLAGLETAALIPAVDVEARVIPTMVVPEVSAEAAFASAARPVGGGLEDAIAAQREAVVRGQAEDAERRRREAEGATAPAGGPAPAPGATTALPSLPGPAVAAAGAGAGVHVEGGITVNINAERLEADAAEVLSDEIVRRLKERLDALRREDDFRTGMRQAAPA